MSTTIKLTAFANKISFERADAMLDAIAADPTREYEVIADHPGRGTYMVLAITIEGRWHKRAAKAVKSGLEAKNRSRQICVSLEGKTTIAFYFDTVSLKGQDYVVQLARNGNLTKHNNMETANIALHKECSNIIKIIDNIKQWDEQAKKAAAEYVAKH